MQPFPAQVRHPVMHTRELPLGCNPPLRGLLAGNGAANTADAHDLENVSDLGPLAEDIRDMLHRITADRENPELVAQDWLAANDLG